MSALLKTTNEAEGLPRRRFTVQEVEWMAHIGLLGTHERVELIGGELVPMPPKGSFHERLKIALNLYWASACRPICSWHPRPLSDSRLTHTWSRISSSTRNR